ncbi:prepilin-type N-terminal cleavage/methylation domain-containing protein [Microbacterium album]|uniref:Prepilin-type N-terminal cleavage/methylation domain-containing protein n=1 Tax=Microbacterium album TaxID=2053191 RepID=A0A917MNR4_9MICO|nr:prepilin-type N-terminal cleavage/methylation domain-containing protein [Microbacterium album]GGH50423.1 hypothetical protein GCM10010921_29170 [Microbacterium album]
MLNGTPRPARPDSGFTLVELLVYVLLMAIVLIVAGGLFVNGMRSTTLVQGSSDAARDAQTVMRTVASAVRNASHLSATPTLIVMRDATSENCLAWSFEDDGAVWGRAGSAEAISAGPGNDAGGRAGWILLATGIERHDDAPFLSAEAGELPALPNTIEAVRVLFAADTGASPTVIDTQIRPRWPEGGSNPCAA